MHTHRCVSLYTFACMCACVSYMWVNNAHMEENIDYVYFISVSLSSGSLIPTWLNNLRNTCSTGKVGYKAAQLTWPHPEHCIISSRSELSPNQPRPCLQDQMFHTLLPHPLPLSSVWHAIPLLWIKRVTWNVANISGFLTLWLWRNWCHFHF